MRRARRVPTPLVEVVDVGAKAPVILHIAENLEDGIMSGIDVNLGFEATRNLSRKTGSQLLQEIDGLIVATALDNIASFHRTERSNCIGMDLIVPRFRIIGVRCSQRDATGLLVVYRRIRPCVDGHGSLLLGGFPPSETFRFRELSSGLQMKRVRILSCSRLSSSTKIDEQTNE
jgi:hypothetical protein